MSSRTDDAQGDSTRDARKKFSDAARSFADPLVRGLVRAGVTPNAITVFGFILAVATAILTGYEMWIAAGIVFVVGSSSDMFDGSVARMSGKATRFGAFFDSNLDRLGEALILGAIGVAMAREARTWAVAMAFLALAGSFLVSYTRARAEGLGVESNKGGLFSRFERLVLMGFALFLGGWGIAIEVVLTILAIGTLVTFAQRLFYVHSVLRDADGPPDAR
ncbi:MAG: CDP-alcohol phosphatidyltransferase family protein [Actinobacteria bacterium]|nr:CDP-alcohol phosphatidyltransferase family protein [Actinomycetota bacterium]